MKRFLVVSFVAIVAITTVIGGSGSAEASNWTLRHLPAMGVSGGAKNQAGLFGASCPTERLCVAVGSLDTIAVSQAPTGAAADWRVVKPAAAVEPGKNCTEEGIPGPAVPCSNYLKGGLRSVSCPSPALCVAVGIEGTVDVSDDPTGDAPAWSMKNISEVGSGATHLNGVSCPSVSLCVAVAGQGSGGTGGRVLVSTNPVLGEWKTTQLDESLDFQGVSCGSPSLCVAVAKEGRIVVSDDPTGGAAAWRELENGTGPQSLHSVGCAGTKLCVVGDEGGNILTSTDPGDSRARWSKTNGGGSVQITGISCPTVLRCIAVDNNGDVLTSTAPTGGSRAWTFENLVPFDQPANLEEQVKNALFDDTCPSPTLCVLVGADSRIFTSTDPFSMGGPSPGLGPTRRASRRPRTVLLWAEHFWRVTITRRHRIHARFHFYSVGAAKGFECKRDQGPFRSCRSPLRYWVEPGRHVLRVRAIGTTGLRGPPATARFRVIRRGSF